MLDASLRYPGLVSHVGLGQLHPGFPPPVMKASLELFGALRLLGCQVAMLTGVFAQIVEFDTVVFEILQQFPVA